MNEKFKKRVDGLEAAFRAMMQTDPAERSTLPTSGGVYLFSEGSKHLYVGRAKNLRRRIANHSIASSKDAPFAFRLAREATGRLKATYTPSGSRRELLLEPQFAEAFSLAKRRVSNLHVRFAVEEEPVTQALLEIYVAIALETPYNDFDVH